MFNNLFVPAGCEQRFPKIWHAERHGILAVDKEVGILLRRFLPISETLNKIAP